jgi:quinol monooxygenase YgiN
MYILTVVAYPKPGKAADLRQACRDLTAASADHEGLSSYQWTAADDSGALNLVEVHADERSIFNHIELADVEALGAASERYDDCHLYGPQPSQELTDLLSSVAPLTVHVTI